MHIPKKVINFLNENKNKPRKKVLEDMINEFNYKESTAATYYSMNYNSPNIKANIFEFLDKNPEAIKDNFAKKYADKLGVSVETYFKYKGQYMLLNNIDEPENKGNENEYYNGRIREKFKFDDSRL